MRSNHRALVLILLAAAFLLLFVAVVAVALFFVLRQRPAEAANWQDPLAELVPDEIAPDLALYPLAGASELETIDAALANGDLETAYATLIFGLDLSDAQRIGRLIILGRKQAAAERPERAALAYQQIFDLAVLSARLTDPERADALMASGNGWAQVEREAEALRAFDQTYVVAIHSPYLQMAQRRELLTRLSVAYEALGEEERARICREEIVKLDQEVQKPPAVPLPNPELPGRGEAVSTAEVGRLEQARRDAALALLESFSPGEEPPPGPVQGLAKALQAEDAAKLELYRQELETTSQPGKRIGVLWEMIRWLTLKEKVALRGFGLSLVPEWEAQAAEIQSMLSVAYEELFFAYEDLVTALPDASLIEPGGYQVRRRVNLAGRLGQYPNYPVQQMADKLQDAALALIAAGAGDQLYVDELAGEAGLSFFLNPAARYGQPPQGP